MNWIALDADDTLWHNETLFADAQQRFRDKMSRYAAADRVDEVLYKAEMRNLSYFGYGIKGFTFSLIETAVELSEGRILGKEIQWIIDMAKEMIKASVVLLDGVDEVINRIAPHVSLMLVTKGDLMDQENKLARSGLANHFKAVEIVSDKTATTYSAIMTRYGIAPESFLMVGNSLRSDVLPVIEAGGHAVYIPYALIWAHETHVEVGDHDYTEMASIRELPAYLEARGWLPRGE